MDVAIMGTTVLFPRSTCPLVCGLQVLLRKCFLQAINVLLLLVGSWEASIF